MAYYTTMTHCKKCGQYYSIKVYVENKETNIFDYDKTGKKIYRAWQEPVSRKIQDPKQNECGYFCDYCGEWNKDDESE